MEKFKSLKYEEVKELISKVLCQEFGFCPVEPKTDKIPDESVPVLKIGNIFAQWTPSKRAYRIWNNDGQEIGIAKDLDDVCKKCEPWTDGDYYGVREGY